MGYLPGMIWILAGVVLAGAVQDFMVLFVSTRRDGRSLGELVKEEMGPTAGVLALVACFMIMVIILAVLAMIVVKALTHSPWGTYTVAFTIPLAILWGSIFAICARAHWRSVGDWPGDAGVRHYLRRLGGGKPDLGAVV
jgi:carbon starvation protein